ncbi:hypothetical protein LCGC14_1086340, partial [marine sediment metagenome]
MSLVTTPSPVNLTIWFAVKSRDPGAVLKCLVFAGDPPLAALYVDRAQRRAEV